MWRMALNAVMGLGVASLALGVAGDALQKVAAGLAALGKMKRERNGRGR
jgi:hypothetical protein